MFDKTMVFRRLPRDEGATSTSWQRVTKREVVVATPSEDLVFFDNMQSLEDLVRAIEGRWPTDHAILHNHRLSYAGWPYDPEHVMQIQIDDKATAEVRSYDDIAVLANLAKLGNIRVQHPVKSYQKSLQDHGCYVRWSSVCGCYEVVYNPTVCKRRKRKQSAQRLSAYRVHQLAYQLAWIISEFPELRSAYSARTVDGAISYIADHFRLINLLYGQKAHRRLRPFQEFMAEYRPVAAQTSAWLCKRYSCLGSFCTWLAAEARARPLPEEVWVDRTGQLPQDKLNRCYRATLDHVKTKTQKSKKAKKRC
jgi:hypothetical protein